MHHMSSFRSAALLFPMALLVACGGGTKTSTSNPINQLPPVSAQTTYSTAALKGTYAITLTMGTAQGGAVPSIGSVKLDGNGNMTALTLTYNDDSGTPGCSYSGQGGYSVNSDGMGAANIVLISYTCNGLTTQLPFSDWYYNLAAAQQGASFLLAPTENSTAPGNGIALQQ